MMDQPSLVLLGSEKSDHVSIRPLWRSHPGATEYWDANWIETEIAISVGAFTGRYRASLQSTDFKGFLEEMRSLDRSLSGKALFETMEEQLRLSLEGDGKGRIELTGVAMDRAGVGNRLEFALSLDASYLPGIIRSLEDLHTNFPVVGAP